MNNLDLIRMGAKNLWRRKLRTFLTVLGVIIGASSIIVMLSLGFGLTEGFQEQIAQWGSLTTINVYKGWDDPSVNERDKVKLDSKSVETFRMIPNVKAVSPAIETYGAIINGRYMANMSIRGVDPSTMEDFGYKVSEGRLLQSNDELTVVFGGGMARNFYDPKSRVWREPKIDLMRDRMSLTLNPNYGWDDGSNVKYKEYKIKTAGILEEGDWQSDYSIFMPIHEVEKLIEERQKAEGQKPQAGSKSKAKEYERVNIMVNEIDNVQKVQTTVKEMGFEAYSLNDELETMKKTAGIIQAVLGGIGAISLLVAAIGITNTMVMSIYERTKEIGVMKVIGASLSDIRRLFLFESALIGLIGGLLGVGFSYLLSFVINRFSDVFGNFLGTGGATRISIIPFWLALAAMGFSALIGVISGYFPARRAMNLSALEAIRNE